MMAKPSFIAVVGSANVDLTTFHDVFPRPREHIMERGKVHVSAAHNCNKGRLGHHFASGDSRRGLYKNPAGNRIYSRLPNELSRALAWSGDAAPEDSQAMPLTFSRTGVLAATVTICGNCMITKVLGAEKKDQSLDPRKESQTYVCSSHFRHCASNDIHQCDLLGLLGQHL